MTGFSDGLLDAVEAAAPSSAAGARVRRFRWPSSLTIPAAGIARARWFYWAFDFAAIVVSVILMALPFGPNTRAPALTAAGLVSLAVLLGVRISEFRSGHLLRAWTEFPLLLVLGIAVAAVGPLSAGLVLFFTSCYLRAVYASTRRTLAATLGTVALVAATAWGSTPGWVNTTVAVGLGLLASTVLIRLLVATLTHQHRQVVGGASLLGAVFDNLDVAVVVGPTDNAPAMMNQAARTLYAELGLAAPPARWDDSLGVYAADGVTALGPEQLPSALALAGQRVSDLIVVLGLGDGTSRHFCVNAAPITDPNTSVREVVTLREVTAQRRETDDLAHRATYDQLTGLAGRTLLAQTIQESLDDTQRGAPAASVLLLGLDGFKRINDGLGHAFGDEVLQAVADRLRSSLRPEDLVARLGGDEFAIFVRYGQGAAQLARRICEALRTPFLLTGSSVSLSASVGLVGMRAGMSATSVLADADLAMCAAKASGAGLVREFHPDMRNALVQRLALETELRQALERDEFVLYYQPLVNLETDTVTGAEALVRWEHPTRGLVPPAGFIPVMEGNGTIVQLGRWILRTACCTAATWQPLDPAQLITIAVNVSARQLEDPAIIDDVIDALVESGLAPEVLTLEITESSLVDDSPAILERLHALRALGVKIAIDDFGTGFSSLSRLGVYPVDTLKIDISFVQNIENPTGRALVKAILALANVLDLDVVAEGIETRAQADVLASLGCRVAHGYHFAKPAPPFRNNPPTAQFSPRNSDI